jgi:ADP-ribose pyrophosphatase YjhB (NUDIX family)
MQPVTPNNFVVQCPFSALVCSQVRYESWWTTARACRGLLWRDKPDGPEPFAFSSQREVAGGHLATGPIRPDVPPDGANLVRIVKKSVAYITRDRRVLFFRPIELPESGAELPGGTLLPGEGPEEGLLREAQEETGLNDFGPPALLGVVDHVPGPGSRELHERHFYHLPLLEEAPEVWERRVEEGSGAFTFSFFWVDAANRPEDIHPGHDAFLDEVLSRLQ